MSNRGTLIKLANTLDEDACGAALDVLGVPRETGLPPGCTLVDIPGIPKCLVSLTESGPFVSAHYAAMAYAIEEVGLSFPEGSEERAFVLAQVEQANEKQSLQMAFEPCMTLDQYGRATKDNIPGTVMCQSKQFRSADDKWRTVAQAYAHFSQVNPVTTGDGSGFGPQH